MLSWDHSDSVIHIQVTPNAVRRDAPTSAKSWGQISFGRLCFFLVDAFASIYTYNILDLLIFDNSKN